ncbi:hypothetical protein BGZ99_005682 [Dissophora globulifera]|uniref:CCHC-type domain-containing protein n=1 Tax=Dissophora globulifera TaxID=979702 RepID=A0A9P6RIS5_9FUNG|nr:hypothetical protein BGZ99_005682 [Dissophora globulifera]
MISSDINAAFNSYIPHPDTFAGQRDGFSALTWLRAVRRFLIVSNVPEPLHTLVAISFLGPDATYWFASCGLKNDSPFNLFEKQFKSVFIPSDFGSQIRVRLASLRMSSTVNLYINETRQLLNALLADVDDISERKEIDSFACFSFIQGCPQSLNVLLRGLQIVKSVDSNDLMHAARQYDDIYHFKPDSKPSVGSFSDSTQSSDVILELKSVDPTAKENNRLRREINALRNGLRNKGNLAPLTAAERQRLKQRGACYRCRQDGHMARECGNGSLKNIPMTEDA